MKYLVAVLVILTLQLVMYRHSIFSETVKFSEKGSLNIELDEPYPINENYSEYIEAADYNGREWIKLIRCRFNGEKCIIVHPKDHDTVGTFKRRIELMSPHNLRKRFDLSDGDIVTVEVEGDEAWWNSFDVMEK